MPDDDDFKPKLGRPRANGSKAGRKFLHQVLAASNLAKGGGDARKPLFTGARIGRGVGAGRVLASRDRYAAFRQRRVIIKSRIVKLADKGMDGARAHLRYIQRDGVTREGEPGQLYDAQENDTRDKAFLDRADGDRHQFRFIVSAEDGAEYVDLKPLTRRLMARMEEDLATRLDWVAVDHFNTGHPHTHILVRGCDEKGKDLIIARDYITTGMRERAAEIVSLDFGPRSDSEIENRLRREIEQERLTSIDRRLVREMDEMGVVAATDRDAFQQSLRAGRLQKLRRLGLAEELRPGGWWLEEGLVDTLRRMGERGDIIKTLHREMARQNIVRSPTDYAIFDTTDANTKSVVGRVMARGLSDEIKDRHYLIVDGVDGRAHYIDIGKGDATDPTPEGNIVRVRPKNIEPKEVDRAVAEIAAANGERYNIDIHLQHDPRATESFAEIHNRRLEAIRRVTGAIDREPDGTWIIAPDHLDRVREYERGQAKSAPVIVDKLSHLTLDQQIGADGATWLDRELMTNTPEPTSDFGFGREVREAQARRRQWLIAEGLAHEERNGIKYRADMLDSLRRRELTRVGGELSNQLGLGYVETRHGEAVEGTLRRAIELASGKYAVIEKSRELTLVPWRPVLDRHIGRHVSGMMRGDSISWTIGRQRGLGIS
ncbi:relaxase/mobilization nuclease RlxS [Nitratireductor luteus]|uniref:relaxase/mobilization nuclease RlxS n=1 Tax=Nitratireductor luteus TaxID=2976980 RepID=UPI0022400E9D|nr:relaxase/mobilization nuclease RlxS [Nitratireductor luteus]